MSCIGSPREALLCNLPLPRYSHEKVSYKFFNPPKMRLIESAFPCLTFSVPRLPGAGKYKNKTNLVCLHSEDVLPREWRGGDDRGPWVSLLQRCKINRSRDGQWQKTLPGGDNEHSVITPDSEIRALAYCLISAPLWRTGTHALLSILPASLNETS